MPIMMFLKIQRQNAEHIERNILLRWDDDNEELFKDEGEQFAMHTNNEGPEILKSKLTSTLAKWMMALIDDFGIDNITDVINII